jgi:hypothetical protein
MTSPLAVADISSYLASSGWSPQAGTWRGATRWVYGVDYEVVVPPRDAMGDAPRRTREILSVLSEVEGRSEEVITTDIRFPTVDVQWFRFPTADPDASELRLGGLESAITALESARAALAAAAWAVVAGPHLAFEGAAPKEVKDLLAGVRLGPLEPAADVLNIRVPLGPADPSPSGDPLARRMLLLLRDAVLGLREVAGTTVASGDIGAVDQLVTAGVSANLCAALAGFAGRGAGRPFDVGFRWARALPSGSPTQTVRFEVGSGPLLRRVAAGLRRGRLTGSASVTGAIGALYDDGVADRFRVQVRGEVTLDGGTADRRSLWVRLPGSESYDAAIIAHREGRPVSARGELTTVNGRVELRAGPGDLR